jgi:hypothetical protein
MPPPMPFKIFVLAAGVSGMSTFDFLVAVGLGRAARASSASACWRCWKGQQAARTGCTQNSGKAGLILGRPLRRRRHRIFLVEGRKTGKRGAESES